MKQAEQKRRAMQHLMTALGQLDEARGHINHAKGLCNEAGDKETAEALEAASQDVAAVGGGVMIIASCNVSQESQPDSIELEMFR